MKKASVTFLGGAPHGIGPSCFLVKIKDYTLLIEAGLHFTRWPADTHPVTRSFFRKKVEGPAFDPAIFKDHLIDAVLYTHLHLDHAGGIPLFRDYLAPHARVWASDLANAGLERVFRDTVRHSPYLYDAFDARNILSRRSDLPLGEYEILPGLKIFTKRAGHMPEARSFLLDVGDDEWAMITGDMAVHDQHPSIVKGALPCSEDVPFDHLPAYIFGTDLTHGESRRKDWKEQCDLLAEEVVKTLDRGGKALIAAFMFGRGPNVTLELADRGIEVIVDGGIRQIMEFYDDYLGIDFSRIQFAEDSDEYRMSLVYSDDSAVIITTAGMEDDGPIRTYLPHIIQDERNCNILTSYVAPDSTAAYIKEAFAKGRDSIMWEDYDTERRIQIPRRAKVFHAGLTAHADPFELRDYFADITATRKKRFKRLCITHGTERGKRFAGQLFGSLVENRERDIIFGDMRINDGQLLTIEL